MASQHHEPAGPAKPPGASPPPDARAAGHEPPPPAYETAPAAGSSVAGSSAEATGSTAAGSSPAGTEAGSSATGTTADPGSLAAGRTDISDTAVAKVAGIAARGVHGVATLGSGTSRALGALRDAVGTSELTHGVHVEVGETQVAVDINLTAVYGVPLPDVANGVRAAVYSAVQRLVGLQVIEVNVEIHDVHVPEVDDTRTGAET